MSQNCEVNDTKNTKNQDVQKVDVKKVITLNNFSNFFDSFLSPAEILNIEIANKKGRRKFYCSDHHF